LARERVELLEPVRLRAVELADDDQVQRRVTDDSGFRDDGEDMRHPAGDMRTAHCRRQHAHALYAVLKRDDNRVGSDERLDERARRAGVIQLDGEEDDVNGPDGCRIRGRVDVLEMQIAKRALEYEAAA